MAENEARALKPTPAWVAEEWARIESERGPKFSDFVVAALNEQEIEAFEHKVQRGRLEIHEQWKLLRSLGGAASFQPEWAFWASSSEAGSEAC